MARNRILQIFVISEKWDWRIPLRLPSFLWENAKRNLPKIFGFVKCDFTVLKLFVWVILQNLIIIALIFLWNQTFWLRNWNYFEIGMLERWIKFLREGREVKNSKASNAEKLKLKINIILESIEMKNLSYFGNRILRLNF